MDDANNDENLSSDDGDMTIIEEVEVLVILILILKSKSVPLQAKRLAVKIYMRMGSCTLWNLSVQKVFVPCIAEI